MSEALAKVKRDMGREAVILHTRTFRRGGLIGFGGRTVVEITATRDGNVLRSAPTRGMIRPPKTVRGGVDQAEGTALQLGSVGTPQAPAQHTLPGVKDEIAQIRSMVEVVLRESRAARAPAVPSALMDDYLALVEASVADEMARDLVERVGRRHPGEALSDREVVRRELCDYIAAMVPEAGPIVAKRGARPRIVAMIGPTGVGKTTTIAKLAAHFKLREGRRVGLVTIDTYRIAAVDQLKTYADIIQVPLEVVMTPAELSAALERLNDCDIILIDTAGRGQNDAMRMEQLRQFLDVAKADETHLVLASNCTEAFLVQAVERFGRVGADRVVFTKLDEAVGFGVLLNVLRRFDKKLSYLTTGQDVPDDIEVGRARRVAELILGPGRRAQAGDAGLRGDGP